jgi:predicted DNA binding CopG/RHH family protein
VASKRKKDGRGGAREGAGRPALHEESADLTVRFDKRHLDALAALASERGLSTASLIREAVARYVARRRR